MPQRSRVADAMDEVGQTVALFRPEAEAAGLALPMQVGGETPAALRLDFDRLRQCLSNLLSNALKHTAQGRITVDLRLDGPGIRGRQGADFPALCPHLDPACRAWAGAVDQPHVG